MSNSKGLLKETPEARALRRELTGNAVTRSRFVNSVTLVGINEEVFSLVLGFHGAFPDGSGEKVARAHMYDGFAMNNRVAQLLVDSIAASRGITPSQKFIDKFNAEDTGGEDADDD